jgi:CRP-like cAMP-binding protein
VGDCFFIIETGEVVVTRKSDNLDDNEIPQELGRLGINRYAMLCCAVLCCVVLCYAMLCYAVLCYAVLCYDMICCTILCYANAMLCYAVLCYANANAILLCVNRYFGEMSLLTREPRSATVTVCSPTARLLRMTKSVFDSVIAQCNSANEKNNRDIGREVVNKVSTSVLQYFVWYFVGL